MDLVHNDDGMIDRNSFRSTKGHLRCVCAVLSSNLVTDLLRQAGFQFHMVFERVVAVTRGGSDRTI